MTIVFFLICTSCRNETRYSYDKTSSTQRIETYPRRGFCGKKCGDTISKGKKYCEGCVEILARAKAKKRRDDKKEHTKLVNASSCS